MAKPTKVHWQAGKRILRYLSGTASYGLGYVRGKDICLYGYVNSRISTTGYCFSLGFGMVSWSSKKQAYAALSSIEAKQAKYIADAIGSCEQYGVRNCFLRFGVMEKSPTLIYCDNQSWEKFGNNSVFHDKSKQIETRYHFIRDLINTKEIYMEYCFSENNVADITH